MLTHLVVYESDLSPKMPVNLTRRVIVAQVDASGRHEELQASTLTSQSPFQNLEPKLQFRLLKQSRRASASITTRAPAGEDDGGKEEGKLVARHKSGDGGG